MSSRFTTNQGLKMIPSPEDDSAVQQESPSFGKCFGEWIEARDVEGSG
jgi:hypothetical protein